jgi:hypothetical protein
MNMESTGVTLVVVDKASDKAATVNSTMKRMTFSMNGMGQEMTYDSDKPDPSNPMAQKLGEQVGKTTHVTVDNKGYITASDDTASKSAADQAGGFMGMSGDIVANSKKVGATYDLVADLPAKGVKQGDTWTDSVKTKEGKTTTTYTVLEVKGGEALVNVDGTVSQAGETEANGMTILMNITGKSKGQVTFDTATGLVKKRVMTVDASGTMEVMGQSVPLTMKIDVTEGVGAPKGLPL